MRTYVMLRDEDETGVSGVGLVAEVAEFSNGKVAVAWMVSVASVALYESMDDVQAIHGHNGKTRLVERQ